MAKQLVTIADLTPDAKNANRGNARGSGLLEKSLQRYGAGRSILVDRNGVVIAGNKTLEGAASVGIEDLIVVQSDGTKLVAVQRTDLDIDDNESRELAIADNRVGQVSLEWDTSVLEEIAADGVDLGAFWLPDELDALLTTLETEDVHPTDLPDLPNNDLHHVTVTYSLPDEAALKWFIGQDDDNPLMPVQAGSRMLERIKKLFETESYPK